MLSSPAMPTVCFEVKFENFQSRNVTELRPPKCQGHLISLWPWLLTCDLEKSYLLRSSLGMYNLQRRLRYSHLLTRYCPCCLFQGPTSPKHEYRGQLPSHPVTSSMTSSSWKKTFFLVNIIWDGLLISDVNFKLWYIFWHFQNGCHFEVVRNFFTASDTGRWICQQYSHDHFRYFEYFIYAIADL